ncbi:MAG: hypothetical protein SGI94_09870 [Saprospiraceae bacterium]|nr:hypothetical protein [Saprospiraceae bacterium]
MKFSHFLFLILSMPNLLFAQPTEPLPPQCAGAAAPESSGLLAPLCGKTSSLWSSNSRHIPRTDARSIRVRANFIIVQKLDGTGNFQDIPEHRAFLDEWLQGCNGRLNNLWGTSDCPTGFPDAKIEIVPNWVFYKDSPTEFFWNNDNQPGQSKYPGANWWLNALDATISTDPNIPKGINVYLTSSGSIYNQMVVLGTIDNPEQAGMTNTWCSQLPSVTNLTASSRISVPNLFLKYWWFQNHPSVVGAPFSTSRQWLVGNGGVTLAHGFGHSFIDCYIHRNFIQGEDDCTNHFMPVLPDIGNDAFSVPQPGTAQASNPSNGNASST